MDTRVQTHKTYGLFTALAIVVVMVILYVTGQSFSSYAQWITYIPFLLGLVLNAQAFSKANGKYVTFGQTFGSCFKAVAIIIIIMVVWSLLSAYIFPEMKDKALEMARQNMETQGLGDEQIDAALDMTRKYFTPFMLMGVVFNYLLVGAIFSLIAAATAPKKKGLPPADTTVTN